MPTNIKVSDAMITEVVKGNPNLNTQEVAQIMKDKDVGMIVICENEKVAGVVTREDIVEKVAALNKTASEVSVKEILSKDVVSVTSDEDLSTVSKIMVKYGYQRIPVIENGKLVGLISDREIVKIAPAAVEILIERLNMTEPSSMVDETTSGECELCGNYSSFLKNINDRWVCNNCKEEAAEI